MALMKLYAMTGVVLVLAESLWLRFVAADLFRREVGHLMRANVRIGPALTFYGLYVAGILVFATLPGVASGQFVRTLTLGALLGLIAYATFDLTAAALFREFPIKLAIVDLAWGTFVTALVASASYALARWVGLGG